MICSTKECKNEAKFKCPTCLKLNILENNNFCSQTCFKSSWDDHKTLHTKARNNDLFTYTGNLKPFPQSAQRIVPPHISRPDYADHPNGVSLEEKQSKSTGIIKVLNEDEIIKLTNTCRLAREVLDVAAKNIRVGITTDEIDRIVHEFLNVVADPFFADDLGACLERNCYPSPLNYYKFPKSCCTSVNEVICHGIPDMRPLEDGDIVNVDITVYHDGFHGDLNETFFVGNVGEDTKQLVKVTHECLMKAIEIVKPGVKYREIGNVIQKVANAHGFSVVRSFCGHGIHKVFHTLPNVPHYAKNKATGVMQAGHAFTIEPMINQGTWKDVIWPDGWTAVTSDGKKSAQFEQTLLVTPQGCQILTARRDPKYGAQPHFMDSL